MSDEPRAGRGRKVLGWILMALGGLSIVDFFSPIPVPTVGASAFISGAVLLVAGLGVLKLGDLNWKGLLRSTRLRGLPGLRKPKVDPLLPVSILRLARERGGELTVSAVAIGLGIPLDAAQAGIDECVTRGAAQPEFDEKHEVVVYRFPEFLPPQPPPEA